MGKLQVTDFYVYRWRYPIGYILFGLSVIALLILAGLFIPGGLSQNEINSALISDNLNPNRLLYLQPSELVFLPYRLLQASSIALFGFTSFSIKLPSILLAVLSAGGIVLLLGIWFRRNVAIITSIIAVTMGQFLLVAQSGHAGISYIFWAVSILLTASLIIQSGKMASFWLIIGFILAGFSLYMPLNIYVVLALLATAIFHPHARHIVLRETSKVPLIIGSILFFIISAPLIVGIFRDYNLLFTLLGIPTDWSAISDNALQLFQQYAAFYVPENGLIIQPVYSLGSWILILLGLYKMFTTKYTTKSYIISFWLLFLVPLVILNPTFVSVTFIPVVLLIAQGVDYLIRSWYRLFPRNPYARIFGLLPLGVVMLGLVVSNIDRFAYGFHYNQAAYTDYNYDISILRRELRKLPKDQHVVLVTNRDEKAMYSAFAAHQRIVKEVKVIAPNAFSASVPLSIATRTAKLSIDTVPSGVVAFKTADTADRFYLYKNTGN